MLHKLFPSTCAKSAYSIDYEKLYQQGFRALVFDIDNTLVPHGADSTPQSEDLLRGLKKMGFKVLLLSDNSRSRVRHFNRSIHVAYIYDAGKPSPRPYKKAVQMLGVKPKEVLVVGDQVFTDVLGANRAGLASVLVRYIGYDKPGWKGWRRIAERAVLFFYRHSRKRKRKLGDIDREEQ